MTLPPQTKYIVGNEACERFSFYGMRSILTLYMVSVLAMSESEAVVVSHLFNACIYILPLFGAWVADRFIGRYRMILFVSLFYCLGHGVLSMSDCFQSVESRRMILFVGLFIIALGAGGIKPCVSAFVGDQADGMSSATMTRLYAAFYWSINLGSFFSFLVIPWVRQNWGYGWAFGIPGIFMALATFIFWRGRKLYLHRAPSQPEFVPSLTARLLLGKKRAEVRWGAQIMQNTADTMWSIGRFLLIFPCILIMALVAAWGGHELAQLCGAGWSLASLVALLTALLCLVALFIPLTRRAARLGSQNFFGRVGALLFPTVGNASSYDADQLSETRGLLRVLTVFLMIIPFWSLFDQTMSSWVLQGEKMQPLVFTGSSEMHFSFGAEEMQSVNPLIIMIFVPIVTLIIYPRIGRWAAPLRRMGCGIILAGVSYACVAAIQSLLDAGYHLSILWQSIPYLVLTFSEILVSTTGLEYAYTAAGKNLKSIVSGFWFLTSTLGNFLIIFLTALVADPASTSTFLIYASLSLGVGITFFVVTSRNFFKTNV